MSLMRTAFNSTRDSINNQEAWLLKSIQAKVKAMPGNFKFHFASQVPPKQSLAGLDIQLTRSYVVFDVSC